MIVESGSCLMESGWSEEELQKSELKEGDIFHLPPKAIHRLTALTDCRLFEASTPQLDDVVRIKDRYGRT